jgi:hypothetical protein
VLARDARLDASDARLLDSAAAPVLARDARLDASDARLLATEAPPEVKLPKAPSAPEVMPVAMLVATDSTLEAPSVAMEATPEVTSPKTEVMSERIWAAAKGAAMAVKRRIERTIFDCVGCLILVVYVEWTAV